MTTTAEVTQHVAEKIEPGAILYSSWGYDQTNIDYYMVTRVTEKSCWIVPMRQHETPTDGFMTGMTVPVVPMYEREVWDRSDPASPVLVKKPIKPQMHRIRNFGRDCIILTGYSNAYLWEGDSKRASHYA